MGERIRIYLLDDHPVIIDGLQTALSEADDMVVIGSSSNVQDGLSEILSRTEEIDVVITDYQMPLISGSDVCRTVKAKSERIKVILFTNYDTDLVRELCLKAGADNFFYKNAGYDELYDAIRTAHSGKKMLLAPSISGGRTKFPRVDLTPTEITIVKLIACKCMTTKQAADYLSRSPHTIETHRKNIMEALEIHTVQELVHFAFRSGYCGAD